MGRSRQRRIMNSDEKIPVLKNNNNSPQLDNDKCTKFHLLTCICVSLLGIIIIGFIVIFILYLTITLNYRDYIDNSSVIISVPKLDQTTHQVFNCTSINPCEQFTCNDMQLLFRETPEQCKYNDWLTPILIAVGICACVIICQCIFNSN